VGSRLGLAISPGTISSATVVKIIGSVAVPTALILPPRAINKAVALGPVPACPLTITPGSIVRVTPETTVIRPARM